MEREMEREVRVSINMSMEGGSVVVYHPLDMAEVVDMVGQC